MAITTWNIRGEPNAGNGTKAVYCMTMLLLSHAFFGIIGRAEEQANSLLHNQTMAPKTHPNGLMSKAEMDRC